jgi:parallel beta helix pectate lyase-like protein
MVALAVTGCATGITRQAENVTGTTARVTGLVISDAGGPVEHWVQYGPTAGYGSESPHATVDAPVNQTVSVVVDLTGLARSTTYHYRLCAADSQQKGGPGCGEDRTFITPNLECGDVITHDFRLSRSMTCDDSSFLIDGIVIGADGLDINLAGHALGGPGSPLIDASDPAGVDNTGGFDGVTIHDGRLGGWGRAIELDGASSNRIRGIEASGTGGVEIRGGSGNVIRYSDIDGAGGGLGIDARGSAGLVVADSSGTHWRIAGDDARILRNDIGMGDLGFPPNPDFPCLEVFGNRNRIELNSLSRCISTGILLRAGADNALVENDISGPPSFQGPGDGIRVEAFTARTLLSENYSHDNGDDGIDVRASSASLARNRADNNDDFGIDAVAGVTDLGDNAASGNGNAAQCRNVVCGP